jgi:hypothetical protein
MQSEEQISFYKSVELGDIAKIKLWKNGKALVALNQERAKRKSYSVSQLGCNKIVRSKLHILSGVNSATLWEEKKGQ